MTRIIVTPELLNNLSLQMTQSANQLRDIEGQLGRTLSELNWNVRQQANIDGQVNSARSQAKQLVEQADSMASYLTDRAEAFKQADSRSSDDWIRTFPVEPAPVPIPVPTPIPPEINPSIQSFLASNRTMADLERLLNTIAATKPLLIQMVLDKLGLGWIGTAKDIIGTSQMGKYMDAINQATANWKQAQQLYGASSAQAQNAYNVYNKAWEGLPIIGDYIKVALDMGNANPVVSN